MDELYLNTVSPALLQALQILMREPLFSDFRLVGGTALSLQKGHRVSVDIDLFTDLEYGALNYEHIEDFLNDQFSILDFFNTPGHAVGRSYSIGASSNELIKLDVFYTDAFAFPAVEVSGVRMASIEEIIAMKLEVIGHEGRKKDFWDIHELLGQYSLSEMLNFYDRRYPYGHTHQEILVGLKNFSAAEDDFDPRCIKGKEWTFIKEDLSDWVEGWSKV